MKKNIKRKEGLLKRIMKGLTKRELVKNKIVSLILMVIGLCTIPMGEGDCTAFVFILMLALPVFFAKENVIM